MRKDVPNQYLVTQVQTASPGELTLMLYNGCLRFLKQALVAIEQRNIADKHNNLIKSMNIIDELLLTLNMEYELSTNLSQLYHYMNSRLSFANIHNDTAAIQECINLMTDFRNTWSEALTQLRIGAK